MSKPKDKLTNRKNALPIISLFISILILIIAMMGIFFARQIQNKTKAYSSRNNTDCFILEAKSNPFSPSYDPLATCFNIDLAIKNNEEKHPNANRGTITMTTPKGETRINNWDGNSFTYDSQWTSSPFCLANGQTQDLKYKVNVTGCESFGGEAEVTCHLGVANGKAINCQDENIPSPAKGRERNYPEGVNYPAQDKPTPTPEILVDNPTTDCERGGGRCVEFTYYCRILQDNLNKERTNKLYFRTLSSEGSNKGCPPADNLNNKVCCYPGSWPTPIPTKRPEQLTTLSGNIHIELRGGSNYNYFSSAAIYIGNNNNNTNEEVIILLLDSTDDKPIVLDKNWFWDKAVIGENYNITAVLSIMNKTTKHVGSKVYNIPSVTAPEGNINLFISHDPPSANMISGEIEVNNRRDKPIPIDSMEIAWWQLKTDNTPDVTTKKMMETNVDGGKFEIPAVADGQIYQIQVAANLKDGRKIESSPKNVSSPDNIADFVMLIR